VQSAALPAILGGMAGTCSARRVLLPAPILLFLLCASPAFGDPDGVHTSRAGARVLPLPKGDDVFHFVIYGDRTGGRPEGMEVLKAAVGQTNLLDPDLVMTVGDLVNGYNTTKDWMPQMEEFRGVMDKLKMRWYPVAGNHDIYWRGKDRPQGHHESNYEKHFGPLWYWFRHKNAAFIVLYSDEGDAKNNKGWRKPEQNQLSDTQLAWLKKTLGEAKDADHVFVFLHHPRWRKESYVGSNWDAVHALLKDAGNVRSVFAGHVHRQLYDGPRDGINYMTLAVVGGNIPFEAQGTGWLNHFDVVTVRKNAVSYASVPVGAVYDPRALTADVLKEIDSLRLLPVEHGVPIEVTPKLTPVGEYTLRFKNPTSRSIEVTWGTERIDRAWWIAPDHAHAVIEPGAVKEFQFRYARLPRGRMRVPGFSLDVDYLGKAQRVSLPTRWVLAELKVAGLSDEWWRGAGNHALRIGDERSALGVSSAALALPDGPFTVEARVRLDKMVKRTTVVGKAQQSEFGLFLYDGVPSFDVHLGGKYARARNRGEKLEVDRWYHLAGVFDGRQLRLYIDGKMVAKTDASGKRTPNNLPLYIGADPDRRGRPSSGLPGWVDEVRVSKTARYADAEYPLQETLQSDADTLLLLHLDRMLGPLYPDHSPRSGHAAPWGRVKLEPVK